MIIPFLLQFFILSITADHKNFFIKTYKKPWISFDNYEKIIKLSFPYAHCCNIFVDGNQRQMKIIIKKLRKKNNLKGQFVFLKLQEHHMELMNYLIILLKFTPMVIS